MLLYVNSCVRSNSRTDKLARELINRLKPNNCEEIRLKEIGLKPLTEEGLRERMELIGAEDYSNELFSYARQFSQADTIVISAPYWDLSFPAMLKTYIENIYITGIVSAYDSQGKPEGLCRANRLYYVTTAGGPYNPLYSYEYIKCMMTEYFGIADVRLLKAEMLDVDGFDADKLIEEARDRIKAII